MANNTITFDPAAGVAYGVNLSVFSGADFRSTFHVKNNDSTDFDFTGYSGSSQMTKSVSVGSSSVSVATFNVDLPVQLLADLNFLGSTQTDLYTGDML